MADVPATTEVIPAAAPVAVAAPAPVVETPKVEAVPAAAPVAEKPKIDMPAPPAFDWDAWDGKPEVLPEDQREFGSKIVGHYQKRLDSYKDYDKVKSEKERLERLYKIATEQFGDDPRLAEIQEQHTKATAELEKAKADLAERDTRIQSMVAAEAKSYTDRLTSTYPEYFTDDAKKAELAALLDEGWEDPETALKVLKLGATGLEAARAAKAKGYPEQAALELAEARSSDAAAKPEPRAAAKVMSRGGAPTTLPVPRVVDMDQAKAIDFVARKYANQK